jgi:hypothetical protein
VVINKILNLKKRHITRWEGNGGLKLREGKMGGK